MSEENNNSSSTPPSNAFMRFLSEFRDGASLDELTEAMQECVAATQEVCKPSELTLKIKFSPASGEAMSVVDLITTKLPKAERDNCIFFPTEEHTLQRDNPRQRTFDLKMVEAPKRDNPITVQAAAHGI